jgi:pimeloyl-ACP methyl ester carboxylesterase
VITIDESRTLLVSRTGSGGLGVYVPAYPPDLAQPICLFVHGYNVEEPRALRSIRDLLRTMADQRCLPSVLSSGLWVVFWRGYKETAGHELSALSPLTYSRHVRPAMDSGRALARYLLDLARVQPPQTPQIHVIGHSLGCRVVLEMLKECERSGLLRREHFPTVTLLAAAVPTYMLESPALLQRGALLPAKTSVLYSRRDYILSRVIFGSGQWLAGEGVLPTAVGRTGDPPSFWDDPIETRNGHSGYFTDTRTANALASTLGVPFARPVAARPAAARPADDRMRISERPVPVRPL